MTRRFDTFDLSDATPEEIPEDEDRTPPVRELTRDELEQIILRQVDDFDVLRSAAAVLARDRGDARDLLEQILPVIRAAGHQELAVRISGLLRRLRAP